MNKEVTLWQLLKDQKEPPITIPMIQRDYAQGRPDKGHILGPFLTDILDCLTEKTGKLTLDFVYGNADSNSYYPLDGQQRLTTLWLVHWYLAFRLERLKDKQIKNALMRFSYQTRNSSRDFCKELCEKMAGVDPAGVENVAAYIIGQNWFFTDWLQDPTVNAMLRALGGNNALKSSRQEDAAQDTPSIEAIFKGADLGLCWKNLTEKEMITFQRMVIGTDQLPVSDDLYIKMNARGKKLTDFENFKADLVAHIQTLGDISDKLHYSKQLDGAWTDIFWNDRKNDADFDGNIDPLFFMFINRFVLNQHCLQEEKFGVSSYDSSKASADIEAAKIFNTLYGSKLGKRNANDDSLIEYKGFAVYKDFMTAENLEKLDKIFTSLKMYATQIRELDLTSTDEVSDDNAEQTFRFLPHFKDKALVKTELKERIYFHGICLFLEKPSQTPDRLKNWLRIVRNLTENAAIDNIEYMITCLRLVNRLGNYLQDKDWDISKELGNFAAENQDKLPKVETALGDQFVEELEKAAKIQSDRSMESAIKAAENHGFFKGAIRFLYTGRDGKPDWDNFAAKVENAKNLFPDRKVSVETIKKFLGRFESFYAIETLEAGKKKRRIYLYTTIFSHNRKNCWKKDILCNPILQEQVHAFLLESASIVSDPLYQDFLDSKAVETICSKPDNHCYRYYSSRAYGVHRENGQKEEGLYISQERLKQNKQLLDLVGSAVTLENGVELGNDFLFGKRIQFTYRGRTYCWFVEWGANGNPGADKICPLDKEKSTLEWKKDTPLADLLPNLITL